MATSQQKIVFLPPSPNVTVAAPQVIQGQPGLLNSGGNTVSGYLIPVQSNTASTPTVTVSLNPAMARPTVMTVKSPLVMTPSPTGNSMRSTASLPTVNSLPIMNSLIALPSPTTIPPLSVLSPSNISGRPMVNSPLVNTNHQQTQSATNIQSNSHLQLVATNSGTRMYVVVQSPGKVGGEQTSLSDASPKPTTLTQSQIEQLISYLQTQSKSTVPRVIYPSPVSKTPIPIASKAVISPRGTAPLQPALSDNTTTSALSLHSYSLNKLKRKQELISKPISHGTIRTVPCKVSKTENKKIGQSKPSTMHQNMKHGKIITKNKIRDKFRIRISYSGKYRDKCAKENSKWNSAELTSEKQLPRGIAGRLFASAVRNVDFVLDQYDASQQALETVGKVMAQTNSVHSHNLSCSKLKPNPLSNKHSVSINTGACVSMNNNTVLVSKDHINSSECAADTSSTLEQDSDDTTLAGSKQETRIRLCFIVLQRLPESLKSNTCSAGRISFDRAQVLLAKNGRCSMKCREDVVRKLYKSSKTNPYPFFLKPQIVFSNTYLRHASIIPNKPVMPVANQILNLNRMTTHATNTMSHSAGMGETTYIRVEPSSANILGRPCVIKRDVKGIMKGCPEQEPCNMSALAEPQTSPIPVISTSKVNSSTGSDGTLNKSNEGDNDSKAKADNKNGLDPVCPKTPTKIDLCNKFPVPNWKYGQLNQTYMYNRKIPGSPTRLVSTMYGERNKLSPNPKVVLVTLPKKYGKLISNNSKAGTETVASEMSFPSTQNPVNIRAENLTTGNYSDNPCSHSVNGPTAIKGYECTDLKESADRKTNVLEATGINTVMHSIALSDHNDTSTWQKDVRSSTRRPKIQLQSSNKQGTCSMSSIQRSHKDSTNPIPRKNSQTVSLANIANGHDGSVSSRKSLNLAFDELEVTLKKKNKAISAKKRSDLKDVKIESVSRLNKLGSKNEKKETVCPKQNVSSTKSKFNRECKDKNVKLSVVESRNISDLENSVSRKRKVDCQNEKQQESMSSGRQKIPKQLKNGHLNSKNARVKPAVCNKAKKLQNLDHLNNLNGRTRNRSRNLTFSSISNMDSSFADGEVSFSCDSGLDSSCIDKEVSFNFSSQFDNADSDDEVSFNLGSQVERLDSDDEVSFNFGSQVECPDFDDEVSFNLNSHNDHSDAFSCDFQKDSFTDGEVSFTCSLEPCNGDLKVSKKPLHPLIKMCSNKNKVVQTKGKSRKINALKKDISNPTHKSVRHGSMRKVKH